MGKLYELARMTTATTGTGTITLGSAVTSFLSFAAAGVVNGETVSYAIKDGNAREVGEGVYSSSGTTLTRNVIASTNSDLAINLSGSAEVFITPAAKDFYTLSQNLDTNAFDILFDNAKGIRDDSNNELLLFVKIASAVNFLEAANAATGNAVALSAKGDDTNISLNLVPKGTGVVQAAGVPIMTTGKHTTWIPAGSMTPRSTNGAARVIAELATNDIMLSTLDFDQTTEEGAGFIIAMPKSWNEGTVTFQPYWTASSGTGGVVWGLAAHASSNDDPLDTAVSGQQTSTDTLIATNDCHVGPESSAITIGGTPAENDLIYFEITREVANGSDTLTADAKLIGIKFCYTTNAATDV